MTTRTIIKLYDSYDDAADTVRDLEAAGIAHDDISLMANNADNRYVTADTTSKAGAGAGTDVRRPGHAGQRAASQPDAQQDWQLFQPPRLDAPRMR